MADLATLRIAIDTSDFARAKNELKQFSGEVGKTEDALSVKRKKSATDYANDVSKSANDASMTWRKFTAERMGEYMRLEGGHAGAMKRMGAEWQIYKSTGISASAQITSAVASSANAQVAANNKVTESIEKQINAKTRYGKTRTVGEATGGYDPTVATVRRAEYEMIRANTMALAGMDAAARRAAESKGILSKYSHQLKRTLMDLTPIISGVGLLTLAHGAIQATDKYTKLTSQLKIATNSAIEYGHALSEVKRISSAAQADITAITSLYQRLSLATQASGVSQKEIAMITETVALGLKANGASARESASAMLQLSQSFGSGRMAGEEFNSMAEAAPNVLRALAKSMGVPYGMLKTLASETKITTDVMVKAFTDPALLETFRAQAASMRTITGSWVELTNALVLYVGENAKASGGVGVISGTLSLLADNLKIVADTLVIAASILLTRFVLGLTVSTANSILLTAANIRLSASFVAITASATASAAAMGVATLAARTLQAAMGPIGWISLAVGAGVTAWMAWGDEGEKAVNKVDGVIKKANNSFAETDNNLLFISKSWAELQAQFAKGDISQAQFAAGITKMYDDLLPKATKAQKELSKSQEELNKQLAEGRKYYNDYWTGVETSTEKLIEQAKQIEWDNSLIGLSKDAIAAATKERENEAIVKAQSNLETMKSIKDTLPKEIQLQEELISALKRKQAAIEGKATGEAAKAATDAQTKAAKEALAEQTKAHEEMWKKVDGFAHDAFDNIFDKGKNAFQEIGKAIKKYVLDMLYQMTVQEWILNVGVGAGGTMAAGAAQAFGGGGGGGSSWLSAGKSLYDGFSGAFTYSSTATTGLSGMFNNFATSSIGQSMGLSTPSAFYSSPMGTAVNEMTSAATTMGTAASYIGAGLAGIGMGTMIAGDKKVMGMSGSTTSTIGAVAGAIFGGPIGAAIGGALGGVFSAAFGRGPKVSGTTTLAGSFSEQGFAGNYQTPWSQKGGWFRSGRSGVDITGVPEAQMEGFRNLVDGTRSVFDNLVAASGDAQKSLSGWTYSINQQVATEEQANALTLAMAESMGNYMIPSLQQFKLEGENLADTAVRMRDIFIMTDSVLRLVGGSFGAVGLASMEARDNLVNLMGGIQSMNSTMQSYYQNFFTDAERYANDLGALTLQFASLGLSIPQSANEFKLLVSSQDLSTESGRQLFAVLMSLQGAFAALIPSAEAAEQAVRDNIKALQDKAIEDYKAARDAVDSLRAFALSVRELQQALWAGSQTPMSSTYDVSRSQFSVTNMLAGMGDTNAQGNLAGSATQFLDAAKLQATSAIEYARDFAFVQNSLSETATLTEDAVSVADLQLEELKQANAWLSALDEKSASQAQSLDYLLTSAIASSEAARMSVVEQAISSLTNEIAAAVGGTYSQANLARTAGADGSTVLSYADTYKTISGSVSSSGVSGGISTTVSAEQSAALEAKRISDEAAAMAAANKEINDRKQTAWDKAFAATKKYWDNWPSNDQNDIANSTALSAAWREYAAIKVAGTEGNQLAKSQALEYAKYMEAYAPTRAYLGSPGAPYVNQATQGAIDAYNNLPAFAIGTNEVPFDMTARIHAGEEIKPRQFVEKDKSDKKETNELLRKLIAANDDMKKELVAIKSTNYKMWQIDDKHDIEGMPDVRAA